MEFDCFKNSCLLLQAFIISRLYITHLLTTINPNFRPGTSSRRECSSQFPPHLCRAGCFSKPRFLRQDGLLRRRSFGKIAVKWTFYPKRKVKIGSFVLARMIFFPFPFAVSFKVSVVVEMSAFLVFWREEKSQIKKTTFWTSRPHSIVLGFVWIRRPSLFDFGFWKGTLYPVFQRPPKKT